LSPGDEQVSSIAAVGATQLAVGGALYALGLIISAALSAYDSPPAMAACMTALNAAVSCGLLWWGLLGVDVRRPTRVRATLWVPLAWDALILSQLPYLGFFFIPLEAAVASALLRRLTGLAWGRSLAIGFALRLVSLALTYLARPAVKLFFPWHTA
jgi:hypothetical protein